ncbi:MAG: DUF2807 domain-containing protein [Spirochaetales bacterium]|nr:DUF2807 domain-containing protein [Spirochaetales bacterium]
MKDKKRPSIILFILIICIVTVFESCWIINQKIGSGKVTSRDIFLGDEFTRISSNVPGQIILTQSPAPYINLVGDDNILAEIEVRIENSTLYLEINPNVSFSSYALFIYVPVSRLTGPESPGAG